jgi:DNA-binding GntR family transcriptional regulator
MSAPRRLTRALGLRGRRRRRGAGGGARLPAVERAYREIKRRILENEMPAGYQAVEQEVADLLGLSRTPTREALVRLAGEGLVELRPRHGMRVLPVSARDMREIYEVLTALESAAAELVARRGLPAEELDRLEEAVSDMDAALARGDLKGWADADERFHLLLVELCGNRRLRAQVVTSWEQAHRARMSTLRLRPKPTRSNLDHRAVVDAIRARDPERAREIHREHRVRHGEMLVRLLEDHGLAAL